MTAARESDEILFNGTPIQIYADLSKKTLFLRKALRPLLAMLKERHILYRWGFPFQLTAYKDGVTASFTCLEDLPNLVETFQLPKVQLPDWPALSGFSEITQREPWMTSSHKRSRRATQD